jgi:hypothetical protein
LPKDPYAAYRHSGWRGWSDWVGTSRKSTQEKGKNKRSFAETTEFAQSLNLKSKTEWFKWTKANSLPDGIPANPADSYQGNGWQGWSHFLGTTNKKAGDVIYRDFADAREWARSQGLRSQAEWIAEKSNRLPKDIPARPSHVYRHQGWTTWGDWLGKGERHSKNRQWRPFVEARDYIRTLNLRSGLEWNALCKSNDLPSDIPADPGREYRNSGWHSLGDWLGTDTVASNKRQFLPFEKARELVRARGFQTKTEYEAWARSDERPSEIIPGTAIAHIRQKRLARLGRLAGSSQ